MKNFLLYLWELPQNVIGLCFKLLSQESRSYICNDKKEVKVYFSKFMSSGISLGKYIILNDKYLTLSETKLMKSINHENGHRYQSLYLGLLYLIAIGLPSLIWNILKSIGCFKDKDYYSFYPEKWADKLGNVKRF